MLGASLQSQAAVNGNEKRRRALQIISPLEGEMSPKVTEGGGSVPARYKLADLPRHTPLCPAGHLPLKGGDRLAALSILPIKPHPGGMF